MCERGCVENNVKSSVIQLVQSFVLISQCLSFVDFEFNLNRLIPSSPHSIMTILLGVHLHSWVLV